MTRYAKLLQALVLLGVFACEDTPEEPAPSRPRTAIPAAKTLEWTVPPTWTVQRTADSGEYRGKYTIEATGDAKHQAEMLVSHVGNIKVDEKLDGLLADFEGPGKDDAERKEKKVGDFVVKTLDVSANYRFPMAPPVGAQKRVPVHMLKENWRALAAGVETPDRGNWFFRLVGPEDTVAGAKSAFMTMIDGLK